VQVKALKTAQEAGIRFPDFLTHAIYDAYVTVPSGRGLQNEAERLP